MSYLPGNSFRELFLRLNSVPVLVVVPLYPSVCVCAVMLVGEVSHFKSFPKNDSKRKTQNNHGLKMDYLS